MPNQPGHPIDALTEKEIGDWMLLQREMQLYDSAQIGLTRVYLDGKMRAAIVRYYYKGDKITAVPIAVLLTERDTIEFPPDRPVR